MITMNRQASLERGSAALFLLLGFFALAGLARPGLTLDSNDSSIAEIRDSALEALNHGDWESAAKLYRRALVTDGGLGWANAGLADVYRANGAWAKAAEYYRRAIPPHSTNSQVAKLADLCRQASAEQRTGAVRAETLLALSEPGWSDSVDTGSRGFSLPAMTTERRIPLQILFPRNQFAISTLTPEAMSQLDEAVKALSTAGGLQRLVIEGHTCRCGSDAANMELGRKRAEAVRQFLLTRGVASADRISVQSFGASKPVETAGASWLPPSVCDRDEIHSQNRRVVIIAQVGQMGPTAEQRMTPPMEVSFLLRRPGSRGFEPLSENAQVRQLDEVKLQIRARSPLYAYAFHHGSGGEWQVLFPIAAYSLTNPLEPGRRYEVPTPDAGFIIDEKPGSEDTYVYSSPTSDPRFEDLVKLIQDADKAKTNIRLLPPILEPTSPVPQGKVNTFKPTSTTPGPPPPPQKAPPNGPIEDEIIVKGLSFPCVPGTYPPSPQGCVPPEPRLPEHPLAHLHIQHVK